MSKDMEYYRIFRGGDDNIPLLDQVDGYDYLDAEKPIEEPKLMLFELGDPVPRKPKMADYHSSPECIVSKKDFRCSSTFEYIRYSTVACPHQGQE